MRPLVSYNFYVIWLCGDPSLLHLLSLSTESTESTDLGRINSAEGKERNVISNNSIFKTHQ